MSNAVEGCHDPGFIIKKEKKSAKFGKNMEMGGYFVAGGRIFEKFADGRKMGLLDKQCYAVYSIVHKGVLV